jgi:hypothetical protein
VVKAPPPWYHGICLRPEDVTDDTYKESESRERSLLQPIESIPIDAKLDRIGLVAIPIKAQGHITLAGGLMYGDLLIAIVDLVIKYALLHGHCTSDCVDLTLARCQPRRGTHHLRHLHTRALL